MHISYIENLYHNLCVNVQCVCLCGIFLSFSYWLPLPVVIIKMTLTTVRLHYNSAALYLAIKVLVILLPDLIC